MYLGMNLQQRYLSPDDRLVGFLGDAGAGKSLLIRGMFPGLELTNDDNGINMRPLPLLDDVDRGHFRCHTYHLDVRFESAFTQPWKIAEAIKEALKKGRRVVVEHFDLVYPFLGVNAEVLIGVGEEVIVTRPTVFGPEPKSIADIVFESIKYRRMAHSAEDLTSMILEEMGLERPDVHSDIKHGFVLELPEKPDIDLDIVEQRVLELIEADLPISCSDDEHIRIGEMLYPCTGPRIHIKRTSDIKGFHLLKEFRYDSIEGLYTIAGIVGDEGPNRAIHLVGGRKVLTKGK